MKPKPTQPPDELGAASCSARGSYSDYLRAHYEWLSSPERTDVESAAFDRREIAWKRFEEESAQNDPKLSDCGARRGSCVVERSRRIRATKEGWLGRDAPGQEIAATVTRGAVRCSAWLGVAVVIERSPFGVS